MPDPPKPAAAAKPTMSLYPELLRSEKPTISAAPIRYDTNKAAEEEAQKKKKDASLQFQPLKRPQPQQKGGNKKKGFPSSASNNSSSSLHKFSSSVNTVSASSPPKDAQATGIHRSTFEDWVADDDDDFYLPDRPKHIRGGKGRKKKKGGQEVRTWDWDDIYDPSRPNVFADYKGSEEQHREVRDWKARLYHRQLREAKKGRSKDEESGARQPANRMFAPPSQQMNFAPPTFDDAPPPPPPPPADDDDDDYYPSLKDTRSGSDTTSAPAFVQSDASGEDAYQRRMRMSGMASSQSPPAALSPSNPSTVPTRPSPTVPPPTMFPSQAPPEVATPPAASSKSVEERKAEALAKIAAFKAKLMKRPASSEAPQAATPPPNAGSNQPEVAAPVEAPSAPPPPPPPPSQEPGVIVSRAPVRYNVPAPVSEGNDSSMDIDDRNQKSDAEQTQPSRPSKKGLGERLLKKYGWEKGQGLGAQGEGITTALFAKADKRKKRSDAEGGGWAQPANMGKIVGGKRRKVDNDNTGATNSEGDVGTGDARFGTISSVIKLNGMLSGLDVQKEIEDNNLMQEIGDEMGNNYGTVERVFIWREALGGKNEVFVKFTSQMSALRAVNATDGMTFADNEVQAGFFDEGKFEAGEYV